MDVVTGTTARLSCHRMISRVVRTISVPANLTRMKTDFSHSWANLAKMHDLRVWTIAHAPTKRFDFVRLREIHMLNKEMWAVYH